MWYPQEILSRKVTHHLKIDGWKTTLESTFLLKWSLFREDVDFSGVELLTPVMKGGRASIYSISQHENCCKLVIIPQ